MFDSDVVPAVRQGSSPDLVPLELSATSASVEIHVLDAKLTRVAQGFGEVRTALPPGLYQVQYRLGSALDEELISLKPGRAHRGERKSVAFPTAAPIPGSTTDSKDHEATLADLTADAAPLAPGEGEIIVFIRELQASTDGERAAPADQLAMLTLHDAEHHELPRADAVDAGASAEERHPTGRVLARAGVSCASLRARVAAGGHTLRVKRPARQKGDPDVEFAQSLWVEPGWLTIVFAPMRRNGPGIECASVHMVRAGTPWSLDDPEIASAALVVESVLEAMRQGRRSIAREHERELLDERAVNPMLAIVGAHSLLLAKRVDWALFDDVVRHLQRVMPRHPDVVALAATGAEMRACATRREAEPPPPPPPELAGVGGITWPPMLLASYRGILRADALWPSVDLVKADTMAERAAAGQVLTGTWTCWRPEEPAETGAWSAVGRYAARVSDIAVDLKSALVHRISGSTVLDEWDYRVDRELAKDPQTEALRYYLRERVARTGKDKASVQDFVQSLEPRQLAHTMGLPSSTVKRALDHVHSALKEFDPPK